MVKSPRSKSPGWLVSTPKPPAMPQMESSGGSVAAILTPASRKLNGALGVRHARFFAHRASSSNRSACSNVGCANRNSVRRSAFGNTR